VRELRATMRSAAVLADDRLIHAADLRLDDAPAAPRGGDAAELGDLSRPLAAARDDFVSRYAAAVLARCGGDREAAARSLDIGLRTLYRYLST
jgi:DNA-binding NtrC family response regulator